MSFLSEATMAGSQTGRTGFISNAAKISRNEKITAKCLKPFHEITVQFVIMVRNTGKQLRNHLARID
ncbi:MULTISPECIES: hypothetical protein [unclassified Endozoicomonas]|uniref:hypothetical protein n=1 Tax=unclassified Endozoicomonas TaxID=2644528 RepID=UPI002148E107|nr:MULTISPECIES: hypothetical protein [unclassified Endozoicomonas]